MHLQAQAQGDPVTAAAARTVVVVGGGISGLAAAWELATSAPPDTRVVVLDSAARPGGKLLTGSVGGQAVDLGPDAFVVRRPEALTLCSELGLETELVAPGSRRAFVWARRRLRPMPAGLALGVPTRLGPLARSGICSPVGLVRPALDLVRPALGSRPGTVEDRPVGALVRRLGPQVTHRLVGPLVGGIHAGDVGTMSAAAVFPSLLDASRRPGSLMRSLRGVAPRAEASDAPIFLTVRGGLGRLVDRLARSLEERGVDIRTGTEARALERATAAAGPSSGSPHTEDTWIVRSDGPAVMADGIVLAVPAAAARDLLRPHARTAADILAAMAYASVAIVTMRFAAGAVEGALDGTGFLVPVDGRAAAGPLITACTWLSSKWPHLDRPGEVLLRASVGRYGDDRHASMADDDVVARCHAELGTIMGVRRPPLEAIVTRWPESFPQYTVGHLERVAALEAAAASLPSVALAGAALHGVGIPACIGSGRRAARLVAHRLGMTAAAS